MREINMGPLTYTNDEWVEIGQAVVPEQYRAAFMDVIEGRTEWGTARWVEPSGSHPMSPALALESIVREFEFYGPRAPYAITYNLAYEHHDTTLEPGAGWGDFTATATLLGIRAHPERGSQEIWFADEGVRLCAVLIRKYQLERVSL